MIEKIEDEKYDFKIEASDWRFSAIICGLVKYYQYSRITNYYIL